MFGWTQKKKAEKAKREATWRAEYEKEREAMIEPVMVGKSGVIEFWLSPMEVVFNSQGRRGVLVGHGYRADVVHEINNNGTFSKKGPYWTGRDWSSNPLISGREKEWVMVTLARSNDPNIVYTKTQMRTSGFRVDEMHTAARPMETYDEWKIRREKL
jgi:hypothetical protein